MHCNAHFFVIFVEFLQKKLTELVRDLLNESKPHRLLPWLSFF